jgi:hypothetical protein
VWQVKQYGSSVVDPNPPPPPPPPPSCTPDTVVKHDTVFSNDAVPDTILFLPKMEIHIRPR